MNLPAKQKENHVQREQTAVYQGGGAGGGMQWEVRASKYKLLYAECVRDKVLLQSTENYAQYSMINHHDGKEYIKKKNIYTHITESFCCTATFNTTSSMKYTLMKN